MKKFWIYGFWYAVVVALLAIVIWLAWGIADAAYGAEVCQQQTKERSSMYSMPIVKPGKRSNLPTLAQEVDCLLVVYRADEPHTGRIDKLAIAAKRSLGCERVVTYPSSYVPILVHKDSVDAVRELLGPQSVLQISPELR